MKNEIVNSNFVVFSSLHNYMADSCSEKCTSLIEKSKATTPRKVLICEKDAF